MCPIAKRKISKGIRIGISILLLALAALIYFYPTLRDWQIAQTVEQTKEQFAAAQETEAASTSKEDDPLYQELLAYNQSLIDGGQTLTDAWDYEQAPIALEDMPDIIGYIEIPDMDVTLPLLLGASADNLAKGAAVLSQTSMPIGGENTNCVIAAHRGYRGSPYFRNIQQLQIGSAVYITNPWETLEYTVTEIRIIYPSDLDAVLIQPGKDMITLLTCHPYMSDGQYRYVVYCQRTGTISQEDLPSSSSASALYVADHQKKSWS